MTMTLSPLPRLLPAAINHLLASEDAAREKLRAHSGKIACFDLGVMQVFLQIDADGLVRTADLDAPSQVTIRLKPADLPLILQNRERAFSYVTIDGDADFANTISQLSQTMRWDAEHDLSQLIGDIAANRLISGAGVLVATLRSTHQRLTETTAEYFLEENPMLMRPQPIRDFAADVARTRDDVERLAKRIARLKGNA